MVGLDEHVVAPLVLVVDAQDVDRVFGSQTGSVLDDDQVVVVLGTRLGAQVVRAGDDDRMRTEWIHDHDLAVDHCRAVLPEFLLPRGQGRAYGGGQDHIRIGVEDVAALHDLDERVLGSARILVDHAVDEELAVVQGQDVVQQGSGRARDEHQEQDALRRGLDVGPRVGKIDEPGDRSRPGRDGRVADRRLQRLLVGGHELRWVAVAGVNQTVPVSQVARGKDRIADQQSVVRLGAEPGLGPVRRPGPDLLRGAGRVADHGELVVGEVAPGHEPVVEVDLGGLFQLLANLGILIWLAGTERAARQYQVGIPAQGGKRRDQLGIVELVQGEVQDAAVGPGIGEQLQQCDTVLAAEKGPDRRSRVGDDLAELRALLAGRHREPARQPLGGNHAPVEVRVKAGSVSRADDAPLAPVAAQVVCRCLEGPGRAQHRNDPVTGAGEPRDLIVAPQEALNRPDGARHVGATGPRRLVGKADERLQRVRVGRAVGRYPLTLQGESAAAGDPLTGPPDDRRFVAVAISADFDRHVTPPNRALQPQCTGPRSRRRSASVAGSVGSAIDRRVPVRASTRPCPSR